MKKQLLMTTMLAIGFSGTAWGQAATTPPEAATDDVTEVVVTGFRSSLQKSINLKREAIVVRDSIVAEDIGKFPEANVAEALQRIPGVYLSRDGASNEGQRISIRGLGSEYNVTMLNGAPVRTTSSSNVGGSSRDFNYDVFASELFGRVDFYKTPLAELEEGGIGGVVDLQTPRPFDGAGKRSIRYAVMGSYNTASEHLDPNAFVLYSNTWGNWGLLIGAAHSTSVNMKSGFEATGGYNSSYLANNPNSIGSGPFAFALDWNDPRAAAMLPNRTAIDNAYLPRFYRYYGAENTRDRDGLVTSLQYKRDRLDLSVDLLFSHLQDERDEFTFGMPIRNTRTTNTAAQAGASGHNGFVPIDVTINPDGNLLEGTFGNTSYLGESYFYNGETKFGYASFNGKYELTDSLTLTGQVSASESAAYYDNKRIVSNLYGVTTTLDWGDDHVYPGLAATGVDFTDPNRYQDFSTAIDWNREVDRERTARLVADWDYNLIDGWTGHLKGGLVYVRTTKQKTKRNGTSFATAALNAVGTAGLRAAMLDHVPLDNLVIGGSFPNAWATFSRDFVNQTVDPIGSAMKSPIDLSTSFTAEEEVKSVFLQSDFIGLVLERQLRVNAGVRYSSTGMTIENYKKTGQNNSYEPNTEENRYSNANPSVSFAYDLRDDLIWRGSWGKTITRASLSLIAAQTVIPNIYNTYATSGNPDLKPQISTNWDTGLEWYFGRGSLVSAGYFKKKLVDTTVSQSTMVTFSSLGLPDTSLANIFYDTNGKVDPNLQIQLATYYNAGEIELDGYELAYQQTFSFLPSPWDGLGALASYTHVNSSGYDYKTTDGRILNVNTIPEYSYSLTAYYEKGPLGVRFSYNYKDKNIIETSPNGSDLQRWHAGAGYLDGNISYKVTDNIEVRLDALNLGDTLSFDYFDDVSGRFGEGRKSRMDYAKYDGRTIKFGIRGKF
ncbi:TonB-dependent receptor [Asticcacaulis sp. SL142]|uniref:TonB-dependent receptor n=1 Tax=Asticcacaulis sp. SL142 TaxID=2995155 RepID=UPI00226D35C9|nr:TonB-dependent receptor [Asticcacaulis sp. SL142]WAC49354.1 TonB-dependent receptor [Asticcacaulis sp. SL142]